MVVIGYVNIKQYKKNNEASYCKFDDLQCYFLIFSCNTIMNPRMKQYVGTLGKLS